MKKVALMFLTRGELYNSDIWDNFFNLDIFNIYIHPDVGYKLNKYNEFKIENLSPKSRGFNILSSLELLKAAIKDDDNYKFVLLSEDCIPLVDPISFYNYCLKDNLSNIRYGNSWINNGEPRYINEINKEDQKANADWWILNRIHTECIISNESDIKNIYSKYPNNGEHTPSTILHLSGLLNSDLVKNRDVLYENYPFISKGGDYATLIDSQFIDIKNDLVKRGYFFLRKYINKNTKKSFINHKHWEGIRNYDNN
jgi:hypothetical protein